MKRLILIAALLLSACIATDPTMKGTSSGAAATFTIETEAGRAICVTFTQTNSSGSGLSCIWPDR